MYDLPLDDSIAITNEFRSIVNGSPYRLDQGGGSVAYGGSVDAGRHHPLGARNGGLALAARSHDGHISASFLFQVDTRFETNCTGEAPDPSGRDARS